MFYNKLLITVFLSSFVICDESWKIYDDSELAVIHITINPESLDWMYENVESDSIHSATFQFQNAYVDETLEFIGFRLRGNTSRDAEKKSFKIDFNHFSPGRNFYDVEKLNLNGEHNDPSIVRSKLCWDLYQDIGMKSTRSSHVMLYINGEYFGLYISIEHIDDTFLAKNFDNDNGNLWKCIWPADLTYRGNDPEDYYPYYNETRPYELKTNKNQYDYSKLARLIRIIYNTPDSLDMVLNIKTTLQYFAINILTGSWDDYRFLRNNFYLYHNPDNDLINWIPYDYDNSFGIDWFDINWSIIDPYEYTVIDNDGRPLIDYMFSQIRYRNLFSHFLQFYNEQLFQGDSMYQKLIYYLELISDAAENDTYRTLDYGFSFNDFLNSYSINYENAHVKQGILEFIADRKESLTNQIVFDGNDPIIYEGLIDSDVIIVGETLGVKTAIFGDIENAEFFYKHENEDEWSSVLLLHQPILNSKHVENHDRWIAEFSVYISGKYDWYIFASNNSNYDKFPIYDYKSFEVLDSVSNQSILINELLAKNETTNVDEAGEYDDWIELWNYADIEIDLANYYLTDNKENLIKWQFPDSSAQIQPNEHMVIWCDDDLGDGYLHTNFKLSSDGEFLALIYPDGETILDSVTFPSQTYDISYGRILSSQNEYQWDYLLPTPGFSNVSLKTSSVVSPINSFELKSIYPNPFNSNFKINLNIHDISDQVRIDLISITGRNLLSKIINPSSVGTLIIPMHIDASYASGTYFLKIINNNMVISKKIILLK
ncbi:MAG: CotH kinase family protein [Candidatus Neomarinimicrobiota bacterium]